MRKKSAAALMITGVALASVLGTTGADAASITHVDSQYFTGGYTNGYYAGMTVTTAAHFSSTDKTVYQDSGKSSGGAYYSGPSGDSTVTAKALTQAWDITLDGVSVQSCDISLPFGFTCTLTGGNIVFHRSTNFGASKPTSTTLPVKAWSSVNGKWRAIQFDSEWSVKLAPNGTTIQRIVGNYNKHAA